ncbi:MAG: hypothetical protein R6X06_05030 [Gammaproteobacteria bacterium]
MKTYNHPDWAMTVPDHWSVEAESDFTSFYDPDGVGELLISSMLHEQALSDDDLEEFAADHIDTEVESEEVEYGEFSGFSFCYEVEDEYLCEWYLRAGKLMLFVTYSCALEDEEHSEEDIVETMLDSLRRSQDTF